MPQTIAGATFSWNPATSTITRMEVTPNKPTVGDKPVTLTWRDREIFVLTKEGRIVADWKTIMELKDKLLANDCADAGELAVCTWAAALWFARNT